MTSNSAKRRQRIKEQSKAVANYLSTTPPPELVQKWINEEQGVFAEHIATQAAQWGADMELEACLEWLEYEDEKEKLRAARRPKPPSLKEQALKELAWVDKNLNMPLLNQCDAIHTIRRALESLPD